MRITGIVLAVLGVVGGFFALSMDVSVSGYVNIGRMDERRNYLLVCGLTLLIGVILIVAEQLRSVATTGLPAKAATSRTAEEDLESVVCPFCAETIRGEAVVCRYCGRDLPQNWVADQLPATEPETAASAVDRYGITYDGEFYWFEQYRYIRLADAVNYAELMESRGKQGA